VEVVREVAFQLRPSVGIWFHMLPKKAQEVAPVEVGREVAFQLRPSVGTWFTPRPQKVQAVAPKVEEPEKSTASAPVPLPAEALCWHLVHAPAAEGSGGRPEGGGAGEEHCLRAGPLPAEALSGHLVHAPCGRKFRRSP
jgi:hypothetical protein